MTSRSDLDKPATALAAILGILVLAVALPFTILAFPETPKSYDATWGEKALAEKKVTIASETGTYKDSVVARDFQPASVQVDVDCNDQFNPNLQQQAAKLHVKLTSSAGATLLDKSDVECKPGQSFTVNLGNHADVATAQATDAATAKRIVWLDAAGGNVTGPVTYTLEVTPSRPAGSGLPALPGVTATQLAGTATLTLKAWDVAVNEHQKEVGK